MKIIMKINEPERKRLFSCSKLFLDGVDSAGNGARNAWKQAGGSEGLDIACWQGKHGGAGTDEMKLRMNWGGDGNGGAEG